MVSTQKVATENNERNLPEQQLKLFAKVFENALEGITITDAAGNIVAVNQSFTNITGYQESEVLGKNPRVLKSERHSPEFYKKMWRSLLENGNWMGEIWNRRANGETYPENLSISSICDEKGEVTNYVAVFHDITEMKLNEDLITYQAYHDALTGLPNRFLALDRLTMNLNNAKRKQTQVAVFYMDLDNFKHINDSFGHPVGDVLLQQVADRLLKLVREEDTVARLGGDEFQIIGAHISSEDEVVDLANRLLQGISKPFLIETQKLSVTFSIVGAIYPQDGLDVDTLIKNADAALYQAKHEGKNKFSLFTSELSEKATLHLRREAELRQALAQKEFVVSYQPKVSLETGAVVGVEALVQWQKTDGTFVSSEDFLPLAEKTGVITGIGDFVTHEVCAALQVLGDIGCKDIRVSVKLTPSQFEQTNLVENILSVLAANAVPASQLELGLTETAMMANLKDTTAKLNLLVDAGVSIAIDSFGVGNSSIYYLKTLPIDTLNIDRSFIQNLTADPDCHQIVETIILMAHSLGKNVVAPGVETKEQADLLKAFGCDLTAGYFHSPPLMVDELVNVLQTNRASIC